MVLYDDIPRIYTALAEWLACLTFCFILKRKISNLRFAVYSLLFLIVQSNLLVLTKNVAKRYWLIIMIIAFLFMGAFLYLCCEANRKVIAYYMACAVIAAEFAASLEWQIANFVLITNKTPVLQLIVLLVSYVLIYGCIYYMERASKESLEYFEISGNELIAVASMAIMVFALSNLSFVTKRTPFSGTLDADIFYIRTLVDLAGLIMILAYKGRICEMNAQREINSVNAVLKEQYDKYRSYQSGMDMINIKYHDLKHQIAGLRAEMSEEKREEWIRKMEEELEDYRPEIQTGNSVLDTIIAGKMMECRKNKIKLTCVADGTLLDTIHVADICTIFGNAIDNAIEAVSFIRDEQKRLIHMSVSAEKHFILVQISNYCEDYPEIVNDLPVTTKQDKKNHGFGVKSINYTVEKYKGYVEYEMKNHWFELKILIPMRKKEKKRDKK